MHNKNLHSLYKSFSHYASSNYTCTTCRYTTDAAGFYPNTAAAALLSRLQSILQSFPSPHALKSGRQAHAQVVVNGIDRVGVLGSNVLGVYVLSGSFKDARNLFYQLDLWYASPWNCMIRGLTMMGFSEFALMFYFKMLAFGSSPDKYTFPYVIKAGGNLRAFRLVKLVHESIRLMGLEDDVFVGSSLIKFYAGNGCLDDARRLFDNIPHKDSVLWNVMLNGYMRCNDSPNALLLFKEMRNTEVKPSSVTYASMLSVCAAAKMISFGTLLHGILVRNGLVFDPGVANSLLSMYVKSQYFVDAHKLFDLLPKADPVTWNVMVAGCAQNGQTSETLYLFEAMICSGVKPDSITFASLLPSISGTASLEHCKAIHGFIVRHGLPLDVYLKSALIDIYFKCRAVEMACKILNQNTSMDIVVCTTMISGYVLNGMNADALAIFRKLPGWQMRPNNVTVASVLPAIAGLAALKLGKELHCNILKNGQGSGCYVGSAITDMYAKCGRLDLAHQFFVRMSEKDAVCWNSMITSCAQNNEPEEAINIFRQMGVEGARYDCVSLSATLSACSNLPALQYGKQIHGYMMRVPFSHDLFAESALIGMYAKCGSLDLAQRVFDMMQEKNEVSWNSIIDAHGSHGCLKEALVLFHKMLAVGIQPDYVTFISIISACGHAGQVDKGIQYYNCMTKEYGIAAKMEHYACMVDLFGRAGRFSEALEIINDMPFTPDPGIWGTLLGASRVHGNVELAEVASQHLFHMDPENSGYYVLLANTHADAGQWEGVLKVRSLMKERKVQKVPGYSSIEFNNATHMFISGDNSHALYAQIYVMLKHLYQELMEEGYVPQLYLSVHPQTTELRQSEISTSQFSSLPEATKC